MFVSDVRAFKKLNETRYLISLINLKRLSVMSHESQRYKSRHHSQTVPIET